MLKLWAGRAMAGARAVGSFAARHRIVSGVAILFVLAAVGASAFTASTVGRGTGQTFPGTSAPGSHQFYDIAGNIEANFCAACHEAIRTELDVGGGGTPHNGWSCTSCHSAGAQGAGEGHVAQPAQCADCHSGGSGKFGVAEDLDTDAHASFYTDLGETATTASWSCKACHTAVEIAMTVTQNGPLPLDLGPTYP